MLGRLAETWALSQRTEKTESFLVFAHTPRVRRLLGDAWNCFQAHDVGMLSGAIAFYVLLAMAPFGVIAINIAATVLGEEAARNSLVQFLEVAFGSEQSAYFAEVIARAGERSGGLWVSVASGVFALYASTRLFWMLRAALNHIWGLRSMVPPGFRGLGWRVLRRRLAAFVMVLVFGLALLVLAVLKTGVSLVATYLGGVDLVYRVLELLLSVAVLTVVIALVYRLLPDARIQWRDVFVGALTTSLLATAGSFVIGQYIARVVPTSMYGAAGSLVVVLLWMYYTAQILFFGAALTQAWAEHHGSGITPLAHAARLMADDTFKELPGTR